MGTAYEYHGLVAETWDLLRGDTSGWEDRPFYLAAIREFGEPALDVGCGTGRLLLDYLAQGIDVDGVEVSPEMLAILHRKAAALGLQPRVWQGEMQQLDLPRTFRTICVPSSSFQLLLDPADAREAMHRFYAHLEPGGALVMPFIALGRPGQALEEHWIKEAVRHEDGATVRRQAHARYDPATGLEHTDDDFQVILDGIVIQQERHEQSPATRNYTAEEAQTLYEGAGFRIERIVGGFSEAPYDPASDEVFSIIGVRA